MNVFWLLISDLLGLLWIVITLPFRFVYDVIFAKRKHQKWLTDNRKPWTDGTF